MNKYKRMTVWFTPAQLKTLQKAAKQQGMSVSSIVRIAVTVAFKSK